MTPERARILHWLADAPSHEVGATVALLDLLAKEPEAIYMGTAGAKPDVMVLDREGIDRIQVWLKGAPNDEIEVVVALLRLMTQAPGQIYMGFEGREQIVMEVGGDRKN